MVAAGALDEVRGLYDDVNGKLFHDVIVVPQALELGGAREERLGLAALRRGGRDGERVPRSRERSAARIVRHAGAGFDRIHTVSGRPEG